MSCHVAILKRPYIDLILAGKKSVESRLYRTPKPPVDVLREGELIHLKESGGPFRAVAVAAKVEQFTDLTPRRMRELQREYGPAVCAEPGYWEQRRDTRFAVFATLSFVSEEPTGPSYVANAYQAWHVVPDANRVVYDATLTDGAIRNRYVTTARHTFFDQGFFTLWLPDGETVKTDLYRGQRVRWRQWKPYFEGYTVKPGDRVRFTRFDRRAYRVSFVSS